MKFSHETTTDTETNRPQSFATHRHHSQDQTAPAFKTPAAVQQRHGSIRNMGGRTMKISFFVPGVPAPGGSKRFVGIGKKTGRAILIDAGGERNKNWRSIVAICGRDAMRKSDALFQGPLRVKFDFIMPRRKGDWNSKGDLKPNAPFYHTTKPDALKLARSTEDALTGIAWNDDAQTAILDITKRYADKGEPSGCTITIQTL